MKLSRLFKYHKNIETVIFLFNIRIDSQLYHSLSTVVALTYETQKCVSLSELSAMSAADVLVEMMMMNSNVVVRSPDHSGSVGRVLFYRNLLSIAIYLLS